MPEDTDAPPPEPPAPPPPPPEPRPAGGGLAGQRAAVPPPESRPGQRGPGGREAAEASPPPSPAAARPGGGGETPAAASLGREPEAGEGAPAAEPARGGRRSLARDLAEVERGRPERAFNVGALLGALIAVAAAVFVVQNAQSTEFDWLWLDFRLPLWTALLGAMIVGVVLVVLAFAVHERRQRRIGRRQDAAVRIRRALGPAGEPESRPGGVPVLRRFRRSRPGRPGPSQA